MTASPIVFIVDDDVSIRESLDLLLRSAGWKTEIFATASAFLARARVNVPSCLVLDVSLPDLNGLEVQRRIADQPALPVIFITGHGDVPMSVRAMKAGAVEFFTKPFAHDAMLIAVEAAIQHSRIALGHEAEMQALRDCHASLTRREREVMGLVVAGRLNKQVADDLGICEITVKAHRGRVMEKMQASSFAHLVAMCGRLGLGPHPAIRQRRAVPDVERGASCRSAAIVGGVADTIV